MRTADEPNRQMSLEYVMWAVGMGILVGGTSAILFLVWLDRRMARIKSTEGRCYQDAGKFDNTARHRDDEIVTGGAMGYPMLEIGDEILRMMPAESDVAVIRQQAGKLITKISLADRAAAEQVYALVRRQIEANGCLPEIAADAPREALEVLMKFEEGDRRLAILRSSQAIKVVEFMGKTPRCVARVANEADAKELFTLMLAQDGGTKATEPQRDYTTNAITATKAEPCIGGKYSELTPTTTGIDFASDESGMEDPLWKQMFH